LKAAIKKLTVNKSTKYTDTSSLNILTRLCIIILLILQEVPMKIKVAIE
jgi:hypothetical protein